MLLRKDDSRRERNKETRQTQIRIASASAAGNVLTLTFDLPVTQKGVPAYTTDVAGAVAVSAASPNPTTIALTFDADISAATEVNIPFQDAAIRNVWGGFVADSVFPVAA